MSEVPTPEHGEIVDTYQQFTECVEQWQVLFDSLDPADPDFKSYEAAAIAEIDPLCPYKERWVSISGRGDIPVLAYDPGTQAVVIAGTEYYGQTVDGLHNGVALHVYQDAEDIAPHARLMHMVVFGEANGLVQGGKEQRQSKFIAHFKIEPATTVIDLQEMESLLRVSSEPSDNEDLDFAQAFSLLTDYSNYYDELYYSNYFKKLSPTAQQSLLQAVVDEAEAEVRLRDSPINTTASYGLISLVSGDKIHILPISLKDYTVEGTILGIESVENMCLSYADTTQRTKSSEGEYGGLCLVIALTPQTRDELQLTPQQVLYIPISGSGFEDLQN